MDENRVTTLSIRSKVQADRRLEIQIPKDVPLGPVEVVVVIFPEQPGAARKPLTAGDLLRSPLFGLWKDREDIGNSLEFAHKLRAEVEQRHHSETGGHT
ncbi:MAG: hypothetical protein ACE5I2_05435 [Anaerolineae bacterium]